MSDWFADLGGPQFATAIIWMFAALILLAIVLVVVRLARSMTFGTFVAGGRNRKTRLAVMDAAAVDSYRRLVLVRRDDVEHLLLIGGPTDVVIEREIKTSGARRAQSVFGDGDDFEAQQQAAVPTPPPAPQAPPRPRAPEPIHAPPAPPRNPPPQAPRQPERPVQPARQPDRSPPPPRTPRQTGARPPMREAVQPARPVPPRLPPADIPPSSYGRPSTNLDDDLLKELEVTFDTSSSRPSYDASPAKPPPQQPVEMTLDDEMTKLLGELSNNHPKR